MNWDTVISMTERSLSNLYRRMGSAAPKGAPELLDADTLVAASAGRLGGDRRDEVAALLADSPVQTGLVRMLHDLAGDAAEVAHAVNARNRHSHERGRGRVRHAFASTDRRLRWVGIAACLMLVVGAVVRMAPFTQTDSSTIAESMQPDRIFTSEDEIFRMTDETAPRDIGDIVFRSDFKGG